MSTIELKRLAIKKIINKTDDEVLNMLIEFMDLKEKKNGTYILS